MRIKQFCLSCQDSDGRDSVLIVYEDPLRNHMGHVSCNLNSTGKKREAKSLAVVKDGSNQAKTLTKNVRNTAIIL